MTRAIPATKVLKVRKALPELPRDRLRRLLRDYELTEASADYAKEYLRMLAKREIVRALPQPGNQPSKYQFIKREMVQPPSDDKKADRLKAQRAKKRTAAIASLDESVRVLFCAMGQLRRAHKKAILTLDEEA